MNRLLAIGLVFAALTLGAAAPAAAAGWPSGPRLAYIRSGAPVVGDQIISADPSNEHWFRLRTAWPLFGVDRISWSPDGTELAFGGLFMPGIMVASPERVEPRKVKGSGEGFTPVFSPDGMTIAFAKLRLQFPTRKRAAFVGTSIWLLPSRGGEAHQLTPWRNRQLMLPSSFSPDGKLLAAERIVGARQEVVLQPLAGGPARRIAVGATGPAFSPDGRAIALVRQLPKPSPQGRDSSSGGDLFLVNRSGHNLKRLTRTPERLEEGPSWDPSGERLAFARRPVERSVPGALGLGGAILEMNADGSCVRQLAATLGLAFRSPVWQPGPGRGLGRIEC